MSNRDRWTNWYRGLEADDPQPYGNSDSYQLLADWVADCELVEDWGCGKGWMRKFVDADRYVGIDGTRSPFADIHTDLVDYTSSAAGIVIRHVLEHDQRWELILDNALASFRQRLGLALFTPLQDATQVIDRTEIVDVPDIGFAEGDLTAKFIDAGCLWERVDVDPSPTKYNIEHVYLIRRVDSVEDDQGRVNP